MQCTDLILFYNQILNIDLYTDKTDQAAGPTYGVQSSEAHIIVSINRCHADHEVGYIGNICHQRM